MSWIGLRVGFEAERRAVRSRLGAPSFVCSSAVDRNLTIWEATPKKREALETVVRIHPDTFYNWGRDDRGLHVALAMRTSGIVTPRFHQNINTSFIQGVYNDNRNHSTAEYIRAEDPPARKRSIRSRAWKQ